MAYASSLFGSAVFLVLALAGDNGATSGGGTEHATVFDIKEASGSESVKKCVRIVTFQFSILGA